MQSLCSHISPTTVGDLEMCEETSRYVKIVYRYFSQVLLATVAAHLFSILILRHSASCESCKDSAMDVHSQHHQVLFACATILEGWSIKRYRRYPCKICWHMSKTLRNSKVQNDVRCSPSTSYPFVFSISPVPCPCLHLHPQPTFAQEKHQTPAAPANHQQKNEMKPMSPLTITPKHCFPHGHHIRLHKTSDLNPSTNLHSLDPNRSSAERSRKPSTFPGLEPDIEAQVFNTPTAVAGKVYYDTRKTKKNKATSSEFQRHHFCVSGS